MNNETSELEEFILRGRSPFGLWFNGLQAVTAAKITVALTRLKEGNISNVKSVGGGVWEFKIDFGPGYRIYFANDRKKLIILLCGGDKNSQRKDVERAKKYWTEYKERKKLEIRHGHYKKL